MKLHELHKAGLVLLIGFVIARFGGVLFKFICVNQMSPEAYGNVAVFLVLYNWLVLLGTLGITLGLMRFVSRESFKKESYYRAGLIGCIGISLIVAVGLFMIAPWLAGIVNLTSSSILYFLAVSIPFAAVYNLVIFYFRGQYKMGSSVTSDFFLMLVRIVLLVGLFVLAYSHAPYIAFLISFMVLDVFLLLRTGLGKGKSIGNEFKVLLIYSLPIFVAEFLRFFALGLDRILLSGFYTTAEAGLYDVAVSLCLGYLIIANSYGTALMPKVAKMGGSPGSLGKSLRGTVILYVIYTAIILLIAQPLISLVNPAYVSILAYLLPLMVAYVLIGVFVVLTFYVNAIGRQRHAVYGAVVFAFLSLALNLYLVPALKYLGAIQALAISALVSLAVLGALVWFKR